jgi:hypothetical protein
MMQPKIFIALMLLFITTSRLFAVSPDIRLPKWYETKMAISEWNPEQNQLGVKIELKAIATDLHDVSCSLSFNGKITDIRQKKVVSANDTAIFLFNLQAGNNKNGWIDIDLKARPDKTGLKKQVNKIVGQPLSKELMLNEIKKMNAPVLLGTSIPFFINDDIAIGTTADMAFKPVLSIENRKIYLWLPPENIDSGLTAESFKAFQKAIDSQNYSSAIAACKLLLRRLDQKNKPIEINKKNGEKFLIPVKVLKEILIVNHATLSLIDKRIDTELKSAVDSTKTSFIKAFAMFNLGQFYLQKKETNKGYELIEMAISEVPSWPLAKNIIQEKTRK